LSNLHLLNKEKLWNTFTIRTSIGDFNVTKDNDNVLKELYGDYHKIFPLQERIDEVYNNYNNFRHIEKITNSKEGR
jgi:hypothetical protein